jgi:hypothetical protein
MLGSDPIRQYEKGVGTNGQGVVSMEPVYKFGGGSSEWVHWYFKEFLQGDCLAYAYVQIGQENSFTWKKMKKGFSIQLPLIAGLKNEGKIRVETLKETGEWFRNHYKVTPPTSVTVTNDIGKSNRKTIWFDSRFYRVNLMVEEDNTVRFRDIHLFNDDFVSPYLTQKSNSGQFSLFTLPFIDGHQWSDSNTTAGLWLKTIINGKEKRLITHNMAVSNLSHRDLRISLPLRYVDATLAINISERRIKMRMEGNDSLRWLLNLATVAGTADLPFRKITSRNIACVFEKFDYDVKATEGYFSKNKKRDSFNIKPERQTIVLDFG